MVTESNAENAPKDVAGGVINTDCKLASSAYTLEKENSKSAYTFFKQRWPAGRGSLNREKKGQAQPRDWWCERHWRSVWGLEGGVVW